MKIKLKNLIYFQIIYNCIVKFLISDFGFPTILNYVTDIITILLFLGVYINKKRSAKKINIPPLIFPIILFMLDIISFCIDFSNPLLFIWGARNIFRFFVFFYCCCYVLKMEDIKQIFKIMEVIFYINGIICLYEYTVNGIKFDDLGGIFGNHIIGGNGPLDVLLIIMTAYAVMMYVYKEKNIFNMLSIVAISIIIASIAELKIYYFQLILLIFLVAIFIKRNIKIVVIGVTTIIIGIIGMNIYTFLYPGKSTFLNMEFVTEYTRDSTYGGTTDINRLSAIEMINERYFRDNMKYKIIGMGLGNAETSNYSFLNSSFYKRYGNTFKYNWFSHAFMYLESGMLGLIIYASFYIKIFIDSFKLKDKEKFVNMALIASILCLMFLVYNQTLRVETMGYFIFLILSIPYIENKEGEKNET